MEAADHLGREHFAQQLRERVSDRGNQMLIYAAWMTPPAALLYRSMISGSGPGGNVRAWMVVSIVTALTNWFLAALYLLARRQGWHPPRWWTPVQSLLLAAHGLCWGLAMGLTVGLGDTSLNSLALVFAIAAICVGLISCGASAPAFFAHTLGIAVPLLATMGLSGEVWMVRLVAPVALLVCLVLLLHLEVRRSALAEARMSLELQASNAVLKNRNEALQQEVDTDGLTGLLNRSRYLATLERMLDRARFDGSHVGVLFIDVDNFKSINDTMGHQAGDEILRRLAERLQGTARPTDVIGRLGGDEIALAIGPLARPEDAVAAAERLCATLRGSYEVDQRIVSATCSIGVAVGPRGVGSVEQLIADADAALYRAKDQGRNRVVAFDEDLRTAHHQRSERLQDLRRAVNDGEIVPYLQPIVDLRTGTVVGAEALARWQHPTKGLLDAQHFFAFAEENGLGEAAQDAVSARVIELRRNWQLQGVPTSFRFGLNLSAAHLLRPGGIDDLIERMTQVRCPASGMAIEVSEAAILADHRTARAQITRAREAGLTVELDDFGTGATSLSLLHELPIDTIKVDRAVVSRLPHDRRSLALAQTVVMIATNLDIDVTAEGIERREQADLLHGLGVRLAQGFLYSPAVPADTLLETVLAGGPVSGRVDERPRGPGPEPRAAEGAVTKG